MTTFAIITAALYFLLALTTHILKLHRGAYAAPAVLAGADELQRIRDRREQAEAEAAAVIESWISPEDAVWAEETVEAIIQPQPAAAAPSRPSTSRALRKYAQTKGVTGAAHMKKAELHERLDQLGIPA